MNKINLKSPIFYIGIDFYQGIIGNSLFKNYHTICYRFNPIIPILEKKGYKIFSLEDKLKKGEIVPKNSGHLLAHPLVQHYIKDNAKQKKPVIAFFKPSLKIDLIINKKGWGRVGNTTGINKKLEDKTFFYQFAKKEKLGKMPRSKLTTLDSVGLKKILQEFKFPFIIQSNRGWAGRSTFLIKNRSELLDVAKKFNKVVKISEFIQGITLVNNAVLCRNGQVIQGPAGYQLTGESSLTKLPMSTCGRGWPADINKKIKKKISKITLKVGKAIYKLGFRGFFGLDFILDKNSNLFLLELNPRLTASFPFYTLLEIKRKQIPLLLYHYQSFLNFRIPKYYHSIPSLVKIIGTEIVQRNLAKKKLKIRKTLLSGNYRNKRRISDELIPSQNAYTLITQNKEEIIGPNQEVFKISIEKQLLQNQNNQVKIKPEIFKVLKYLKKNIGPIQR